MELTELFWWFVLVGLSAQLVDGALGMAFGLVSSTVLLSMGLPPATVSAAVHTAEVFTTGASGASHLAAGNVDRRLFLRLALPGAAGGILGAWALTRLPADLVRPLVYLYLLALAPPNSSSPLRSRQPSSPHSACSTWNWCWACWWAASSPRRWRRSSSSACASAGC